MIVTVSLILLVVSFLLALNSLRKELRKPKQITFVEQELMKEKVLFINDQANKD